jgi:hypothetical protein
MPIYHFDLLNGDVLSADEDGEDFPDIAAAKRECILSARELLADALQQGIDASGRIFLIRDAAGDIVAEVPFREAFL